MFHIKKQFYCICCNFIFAMIILKIFDKKCFHGKIVKTLVSLCSTFLRTICRYFHSLQYFHEKNLEAVKSVWLWFIFFTEKKCSKIKIIEGQSSLHKHLRADA